MEGAVSITRRVSVAERRNKIAGSSVLISPRYISEARSKSEANFLLLQRLLNPLARLELWKVFSGLPGLRLRISYRICRIESLISGF